MPLSSSLVQFSKIPSQKEAALTLHLEVANGSLRAAHVLFLSSVLEDTVFKANAKEELCV